MAKSNIAPSAIVVPLCGGLGNQLFQYATGRALSLRNGVPLILDLGWFDWVRAQDDEGTTIRNYALTPFELLVGTQYSTTQTPRPLGFFDRLIRRFCRGALGQDEKSTMYVERGFAFDPNVLALQAPVQLNGYWQSYRYFEDCAKALREELGQPRVISAATRQMLARIVVTDAICLHVRRGDYITNQAAAQTHGLCSLDYYKRGVLMAADGLTEPHCYVFSDDPGWVRENLDIGAPFTIVDVNGPDDAHQDLWLMAACKNFVIANSSLSWWGAWLGTNVGKKVICPQRWFLDETKDASDLLPNDWVRI